MSKGRVAHHTAASSVFDQNSGGAICLGRSMYNEHHPDFLSACELGQQIAKLWALKLKVDFCRRRLCDCCSY